MRRYKSGSRWAVWRWMDIILGGRLYLRRLHLLHTPVGGVMVHWIPEPDIQRHLHDHPVNFWSFILRGWYIEERSDFDGCDVISTRNFYASPKFFVFAGWRWIRRIRRSCDKVSVMNSLMGSATESHRIVQCSPRTVTLVFYGPRLRVWGFHTEKGWVPWTKYADGNAVVTSKEDLLS